MKGQFSGRYFRKLEISESTPGGRTNTPRETVGKADQALHLDRIFPFAGGITILCTFIGVSVPSTSWACAVCYGAANGNMARATNLGILTLLGVTLVMLISFAVFFIVLARRASLYDGFNSSTFVDKGEE